MIATARKAARLAGVAVALCATASATPVLAQDYPTRPVRIVVASVPGSAPDVLARVMAEGLGGPLGQPVIVENKPGAGGVVGIDSVAKAAADGYTLAIGHDGTMAINTIVYKALPYDPAKDFAAIAPLGINEFVLIAHPSTGVRNTSDFIAYVKGKQGSATYASAGVGTPNHLFMEQLLKSAGLSMIHVPYKGGAAAVTDLVGGQVPFMLAGIAPALPHIRAGRLVAVAVPQAKRSAVLPDVPTVGESVRGFATKTWFGLFAPAGTPPAVIARLNRDVRATLDRPELQQRLAAQGIVIESGDAATLAAMVRDDLARYKALGAQIKLEPN